MVNYCERFSGTLRTEDSAPHQTDTGAYKICFFGRKSLPTADHDSTSNVTPVAKEFPRFEPTSSTRLPGNKDV